jgi:hypothetical protein
LLLLLPMLRATMTAKTLEISEMQTQMAANFIGKALGRIFGPDLVRLKANANDPRAKVSATIVMETPTVDGTINRGTFDITPMAGDEVEVVATIETFPDDDGGEGGPCDCSYCRAERAA